MDGVDTALIVSSNIRPHGVNRVGNFTKYSQEHACKNAPAVASVEVSATE